VSTFVSVGNAVQPFPRMLEAVRKCSAQLPHPILVQSGSTSFAATEMLVRPFLSSEEFAEAIERSELIILHSGAGSVIHAVRAGKTPVVMPRQKLYAEHIDDHQVEFARAMEGAGRVVVAFEPGDLADAISRARRVDAAGPKTFKAPPLIQLVRTALLEVGASRPARK